MTKKLDIFVPKNQEEEYCRRHLIERRNLSNGVKIRGITQEVGDAAETEIRFTIKSGTYFDPPEKTGMHHLLEHFLTEEVFYLFESESSINLNAGTGPFDLVILKLKGAANPKVPQYGTWPILAWVKNFLIDPLSFVKNPTETFKSCKATVKNELTEDENDKKLQLKWLTRKVVLGNENPVVVMQKESIETIENITLEDMRNLVSKIFISKNILIEFVVRGKKSYGKVLANNLEMIFKNFPDSKKPYRKINLKLREKLNKNFQQGNLYEKTIGGSLFYLNLVWLFKRNPFDLHYWTIRTFDLYFDVFFKKLCRDKGWGYTPRTDFYTPHWENTIYYMSLCLSKTEDLTGFGKKVTNEVKKALKELNKNIVQKWIEQKRLTIKARPYQQIDRWEWFLDSENSFGQILDCEKLNEIWKIVKPEDVLYWRDKLLNTEPAIVVIK